MIWRGGQPVDKGYYLCVIVGWGKPTQLYWDGSSWSYSVQFIHKYVKIILNESDEIVDNNDVHYYMNLDDIPMPEGW